MKKKKPKKIGQLKALADRSMQDYFRRVKKECELCGQPYQVAHHFIFKSQSNYLRYVEKNLIFICHGCHSKFHTFNDARMVIKVQKLRGEAWVKWIVKHSRLLKNDSRVELREIYNKYKEL